MHRAPFTVVDHRASCTHDVIISVPDVNALSGAVGVPRAVVEGVTARAEVVRLSCRIASRFGSSAGVALIIDRAACADVSGSGSFSPRMVKISFPGAHTALVVVIGLSVGDHVASGTGRICIHNDAAVFAVLMMRSF